MAAPLDPQEAARLYRDERMSACEIGRAHGLTPDGARLKIKKGGVTGGLQWCPIHRKLEELS